jgi:hypothetical protein
MIAVVIILVILLILAALGVFGLVYYKSSSKSVTTKEYLILNVGKPFETTIDGASVILTFDKITSDNTMKMTITVKGQSLMFNTIKWSETTDGRVVLTNYNIPPGHLDHKPGNSNLQSDWTLVLEKDKLILNTKSADKDVQATLMLKS